MKDFKELVDENYDKLLAKHFGVKVVPGDSDKIYGKIYSLHWDAIQFGKCMALDAVADGLVTPEELRKQRDEMKAKEQEQPND